ncbi:ATP-dependent DNA helicase RecQ [Caballeronia udeis]|uniref:ATP-dependent DNA helicase RecQ n=1 Tax=Caballeronia udeis TaxID=1232866 RepID=A0A158H275_9BURK|nr:RecQ family zinc-binding domain-containing protein [Caballeronia udeis]SAL38197.1 ATP-dependent DNA helicase RecQ [Caballeronia udeis]
MVNTGVYRANLRFTVEQFTNLQEKRKRLVDKVTEREGAGIVYCATVAECNAVHAALLDAGVDAQRYNRTRRGAVKLQARSADQLADERLREAAKHYAAMAENDRNILERMIGYAQSAQCRWRIVLDYFATQMVSIDTSRAAVSSEYGHGDAGANIRDELNGGVCGTCDNRLAPTTITPGPREMHEAQHDAQHAQLPARKTRTWEAGDEVWVRRYGAGVVKLASGERVAVTFPDGQTRTFISRYLRPKTSDR